MQHPLDMMLRDPWRVLETILDAPLHPGGTDATEDLLNRAAVNSRTRLLDIGCGVGESLRLARKRDTCAIGLDRQPTGLGTVRGDLSSIPFQEGSFDVVLGECVLCLSPNLKRTLTEIHRIVEPGGRLVLSDITVEGTPPDIPAPVDEILCLGGEREQAHIQRQIVSAGFEINDVQTHRDDLLAMRDRIRDALDYERLIDVLGDRGPRLQKGAEELETAIESGRIGYVSIVATRQLE